MLITNFASGELSQNLNGRVDLPQYYQGAAKIENFDIIPTGGIKRRVGTQRLAELGSNSRIIPFIVNKNSVYILEFCLNPSYDNTDPTSIPSFIRVWKKGVLGTYSVIQTVDASYQNMDAINQIQYTQNYDTMIFCHRDYKPVKLKQQSANSFEIVEFAFDFYPNVELDDDFDYVMIPATSAWPTKQVDASGSVSFQYYRLINGVATLYSHPFIDSVRDYWCIKDGKLYKYDDNQNPHWVQYGQDPEVETDLFGTVNKYPACCAFFNNRLFFAATNHKPQMVWASAAPDNYGNRYEDFATYKKYISVNKVTKDADLHVFSCDLIKTNIDTVNNRITFTAVTQNFSAAGALKNAVTDYFVSCDYLPVGTKLVSVTENTITVNTSKFSYDWDEEQTKVENLVMSVQLWSDVNSVSAEDYEYSVVATNVTTADCALFFELASDQNDVIKFLSSNRFLAIGTESSIWSVGADISALNINASMQGRYGSDEIQGQAVETATVFFAQGKKGIREFYYNSDSAVNAFQTNNIALLADHVLRESPAKDFDFMTNPYSRLMVVREDGVCVSMLYDKTNGIMAWSRIKLNKGLIRNCAITRGDDENDLIFFVVQDGERYFLELLDMGSEVYLDSRKLYDGTDLTPTDGYTTGAVLFNATTNKTCPIDDIPEGFIGIGEVVYIGYTFKSYIKSMPVVNNDVSGKRRITALQVRFLNSYLPVMKCTGVSDEKFTTIETKPYSGVGKITYPGVTNYDVTFELEAEEPQPVNILSVDALTA